MTCMPLHKTWQMNLFWPMDPLGTRAEMPCIPVHKTWQMNLSSGQWTPQKYQSRDALHTSTQNLADEPILANGSPQYQSRDALHATTQNLADEPTLANGPPRYQTRDALHTSTQNFAE